MKLPHHEYQSEVLSVDSHDDDCPLCHVVRGEATVDELIQCIWLLDSRLASHEEQRAMFIRLITELSEANT